MAAQLTITPDSRKPDLAQAIVNLRAKQLAAGIPSTAAEVGMVIDTLLDAWPKADD